MRKRNWQRLTEKRFRKFIEELKKWLPEWIIFEIFQINKEELDTFLNNDDARRLQYYEAKYSTFLKAWDTLQKLSEEWDPDASRFILKEFIRRETKKEKEMTDEERANNFGPVSVNFITIDTKGRPLKVREFQSISEKFKDSQNEEDEEDEEN